MKEIKKEEMELLIKNNVIRNTIRGYEDRRGNSTGFYRTRNKRYIEDKYVDIAKRLTT